ncbi:MAG: serine/threonine kinase [Nostocales cyanobacterium]|nr:MAG: serine/threonine kinase [Nostocales cyanobacterium]
MNINKSVLAADIDYQKLDQLLAAGNWKEADYETARIILKIAAREKEGVLGLEDIQNFPIEELLIIDQMWVKYSNGHFGFSIQKQIYQSLVETQKDYQKTWSTFSEQIGWRQSGKWLNYKDINCNLTAPKAHLPSRAWGCIVAWWWVVQWHEAISARIYLLSHPDL